MLSLVVETSRCHMTSSDRRMKLPDGRILGFAECGKPEGRPLLYFHGHPGSRFEARFLADAAFRANVRLFGIDRPGMGLSTYKPGRRLLDWPEDIVAFADSLAIERFAVVGFSAGGPYSLACAYKIPDRLVACGVVSGLGRRGLFLSFLAAWLPWLLLPFARWRFFPSENRAQQTLTRVSGRWPEPDRKAIEVPGVKELMAASLVEGLRQGARGAAYDGALLARRWGFEVERLNFPATHLWHGELDNQVPVALARDMAQRIPHTKATFYSEDAHISTLINHGDKIVGSLVQVNRR
jgi:pimeloyl-ACP methyl ester carboxylesterase